VGTGDREKVEEETKDEFNDKLEKWRHTIESKGFRFSMSKTEYLKCGLNGVGGGSGEVIMGGVVRTRVEKFKYLGSIIEEKGDIDEDINHCIKVGW